MLTATAHQSPENGVSDSCRDRYLRFILRTIFSHDLKVKSLAVAEIFRYCKGFCLSYSFFCLLDQKYKRGVTNAIFNRELIFSSEDSPYPQWEEKYIGDICKIQTGKSNTQDETSQGIYPFYVRSPIVRKSNRYLLDCEAVLTVGDGVGTGKVFHYVQGKFDLHQRVYAMTDFKMVSGKYFYYYFAHFFYDRVMRMTAKTSVDSVRYEMIDRMTILVPCKEEQQKIVCFLDRIEKKIKNAEEELNLLEKNKSGFLQQLFI